jgi:hypothetical protein
MNRAPKVGPRIGLNFWFGFIVADRDPDSWVLFGLTLIPAQSANLLMFRYSVTVP